MIFMVFCLIAVAMGLHNGPTEMTVFWGVFLGILVGKGVSDYVRRGTD